MPEDLSLKIYKDLKEGKIDFTFLMSRPQSVQRDEAYYEVFEAYRDIYRTQIMTVPLEGNNRAVYIEKVLLEKVLQHLANKLSSRDGFEQHIKDFEKLQADYAVVTESFSRLKKDKKDIADAFQKLYIHMKQLSDFAWAPIAVEKLIVPELLSILKNSHTDGEEMYYSLASPIKFNQFQKMRMDICDAVTNDTAPEKAATELVKEYFWYNEYSYTEDLCDEEYFMQEMSKLTKEKAKEEKSRIETEISNNIENVKKIKAKIKDERASLFADVVVEYTFLRTERVDMLKKLQASGRRIFDLLAELLKEETGKDWTRVETVKLMNKEINSYLAGISKPDFEKTKSRDRFVFYRNPEDEIIIENPEIVSGITKILQSDNTKQIKGAIAFKGTVKGKVSIILSKADLHKISEGSILVARTTMPDYIHAMEKAAAFVTEEGGITSHAAIIARELKKPCIVGTGNCTKELKDGDMVEVDADKGIVKKI